MRDKAIRNIHSNVVSIDGEIDAWDKDGNTVVIDEGKVTTEVVRLQASHDALAYSRKREAIHRMGWLS